MAQAQSSILTAQASRAGRQGQQKEAKATLEQRKAGARLSQERVRADSTSWSGKATSRSAWRTNSTINYLSAEGAVAAAEAGIETAAAQLAEASAAVEKARADLKAAEAKVKVSKANLDMAKVFVQYTKILSPYDGVVIFRGESVHPGTFIRSASEGDERADAHRRHATTRCAPSCWCLTATCPIARSAIPPPFSSTPWPAGYSRPRSAGSPNPKTSKDRTMRVEIDIDNPDRALRDGMFGRAEILLEKMIKNLSIPSSCLVQRNGKGRRGRFRRQGRRTAPRSDPRGAG